MCALQAGGVPGGCDWGAADHCGAIPGAHHCQQPHTRALPLTLCSRACGVCMMSCAFYMMRIAGIHGRLWRCSLEVWSGSAGMGADLSDTPRANQCPLCRRGVLSCLRFPIRHSSLVPTPCTAQAASVRKRASASAAASHQGLCCAASV